MIENTLLENYGAKLEVFAKGDYLFHEGNRAKFYFQVKKGKIKMFNENAEGKTFVQGIFKANESFGEPPLFDESAYPACAVAEADTVMFKLSKSRLLKLLKENPDVHMKFTKTLAIRLKYKSMLLKEISSFKPEHRILSLIDHIKKESPNNGNKKLMVKLTRQQIADLTGLRVETVIRSVKMLEKEGELEIINRKIYR
jgi:CRP-like cAMP-binding protein